MTITGEFDGGNVRFDRGSGACEGQNEGGDSDAVFLVEDGGVIRSVGFLIYHVKIYFTHYDSTTVSNRNVVIGADQSEGVRSLQIRLRNILIVDDLGFRFTVSVRVLSRTSGSRTSVRTQLPLSNRAELRQSLEVVPWLLKTRSFNTMAEELSR